MATSSSFLALRKMLESRLERKTRAWLKDASKEIADGVPNSRFSALLSLASRHARQRDPLAPSAEERAAFAKSADGQEVERWTLLETLRIALVLSRTDLGGETGAIALEEAFRFADEGEACALYRSLALLPGPTRFLPRAREGCRTNMLSVFQANVLDTPYPLRHFDDLAWSQAAIKCLFVGAPLWRLQGLDERLSEDLARMALDLVDERRSAGRPVQPELWLLLSSFGGERARAALEVELDPDHSNAKERAGAALALARAGAKERLRALAAEDKDPLVAFVIASALNGESGPAAYRELGPEGDLARTQAK